MSRSYTASLRGGRAAWLEALEAFTALGTASSAATAAAAKSPSFPSSSSPTPSSSSRGAVSVSAGGGALPDLRARLDVCEAVARAHLFGPPGFHISDEALRVVRQTRWAVLGAGGTPREKAIVLERLLRLYADAARALLYEAVPSQPERQCLLLEQVQCLVEARVAGIPLSTRHYRYPLQSPQLADIGADLPLLLLREVEAEADGERERGGASGAAAEDRELFTARLDCAVGLAGAGQVAAALRLCPSASGFPYIIRNVASMQRDGWRAAWQLADAVPLETLLASGRGGADVAGWLNGLLDAARRKYKATADPEVKEWVVGFMRVWYSEEGQQPALAAAPSAQETQQQNHQQQQQHSDKGAETGPAGTTATPTTSSLRYPLPVRVIDTYLAVCPASAWQEALQLVTAYNETGSPFPVAGATSALGEKGSNGASAAPAEGWPRVAMGRLMTLLSVAQQPREVLRIFYGAAADAAALEQQPGDAESVRALVEAARPSTETLSASDLRHPATYNHAMMALAQLGHWGAAMRFHESIPVSCRNRHTHWSAARMFLQPRQPAAASSTNDSSDSSSSGAVAYLRSAEAYSFCLRNLKRAWQEPGQSDAAGGGGSGSSPSFPEAEAIFENMALWAASRGDWRAVSWLAANAPRGCRYIKMIALAAALRACDGAKLLPEQQQKQEAQQGQFPVAATHADKGKGEESSVAAEEASREVARQLNAILFAPDVSVKQACMAAAMVANSATAVTVLGGPPHPSSRRRDDGVGTNEAVETVLRPELADAFTSAIGTYLNGSQAAMDQAIGILIGQFTSLRQRQIEHANGATPPAAATAASLPSLERGRVLAEVMDLVQGLAPNRKDGWRVVLQLLTRLGEEQRLSIARAAPAMVSAGMNPDVAIRFLDP